MTAERFTLVGTTRCSKDRWPLVIAEMSITHRDIYNHYSADWQCNRAMLVSCRDIHCDNVRPPRFMATIPCHWAESSPLITTSIGPNHQHRGQDIMPLGRAISIDHHMPQPAISINVNIPSAHPSLWATSLCTTNANISI